MAGRSGARTARLVPQRRAPLVPDAERLVQRVAGGEPVEPVAQVLVGDERAVGGAAAHRVHLDARVVGEDARLPTYSRKEM